MKFILLIVLTLFFVFKMRKKTYYGIDKKIGRGVFCHNILLPGEVIEISPTLHIEKTVAHLSKKICLHQIYILLFQKIYLGWII